MATLYHWDMPQSLEDRGGWTSRDTAERFADLTTAVHDRLGDRVPTWTTLNEPWCSSFLGYGSGDHAPGRRDAGAAFTAVHHLLVAHGLSAAALRSAGAAELSYTTIITSVTTPDPHDEADAAAVRLVDGLHNRLFLDPVLRGRYPADLVDLVTRHVAPGTIRDGDEALIGATPIDVLGLNYYQPTLVRARPGGVANPQFPGTEGVEFLRADLPRTHMDWPVDAGRAAGLAGPGLAGLPRRPDDDHRERRGVRGPGRGRPRRGRRAHRVPARPPPRRRTRRSRPAPTSAATSPGRCSTTSSGPTGTTSASGSSTSTTRPRSGCRRTARPGTAR